MVFLTSFVGYFWMNFSSDGSFNEGGNAQRRTSGTPEHAEVFLTRGSKAFQVSLVNFRNGGSDATTCRSTGSTGRHGGH
jgi:hypothetical protein